MRGFAFSSMSRRLADGYQLALGRLWVAVARGIDLFAGPNVLWLQRDDIVCWQPMPGARLDDHQVLYADNMRFAAVPHDETHDSLVAYEWNDCAMHSPLVAWWNYDSITGAFNVNWDQTNGIVQL